MAVRRVLCFVPRVKYMVTYVPYYRDGCTPCDVFCATCNILEYMKVEGAVDVFQTARQLQRHRPEFFKDFVSFELLITDEGSVPKMRIWSMSLI